MVQEPGHPVDHAVDAVHRPLRARAAREPARGRRTRTTCARRAPRGCPSGGCCSRHTLRTSMITFVSLFGLDFGALVGGGALLTEVVFGIHGVGFLTYQSLTNLDLPVIMATVIYGAFFIVAGKHARRHRLRLARPEDPARPDARAAARGQGPQGLVPHRGRRRPAPSTASRFALAQGEVLGIVGESGSGKSVTMMSVMRLIIDPNAVFEGEVHLQGPRPDEARPGRRCARSAAPRSR